MKDTFLKYFFYIYFIFTHFPPHKQVVKFRLLKRLLARNVHFIFGGGIKEYLRSFALIICFDNFSIINIRIYIIVNMTNKNNLDI